MATRPNAGEGLAQEAAALKPRCAICGAEAACYGSYEGKEGYSCNSCCGHGCEDGFCEMLDSQ